MILIIENLHLISLDRLSPDNNDNDFFESDVSLILVGLVTNVSLIFLSSSSLENFASSYFVRLYEIFPMLFYIN